jgi:DNA-binding MarR family transcriptional regulator
MLLALRFLLEHPGASNREIAAAASISDEGQASRLMSRLSDLGLARNAAPIARRARAWHLTEAGRREAARTDGTLSG